MSGGSFNYLHEHSGERDDDLDRMADELDKLGFPEFADETRACKFGPSPGLRAVWKEIEWWRSMDTSRDDAIRACIKYLRQSLCPTLARCHEILHSLDTQRPRHWRRGQ